MCGEGPLIGHHYKSECSLSPSLVYRQSSLVNLERDEVLGRILKVRSSISGKLTNCTEVLTTGALGKDMQQGRGADPRLYISWLLTPCARIFRQTDKRPVFCSHNLPCVALHLDRDSAKIAKDTLTHQEGATSGPQRACGKECLTETESAQPPRARQSRSTSTHA